MWKEEDEEGSVWYQDDLKDNYKDGGAKFCLVIAGVLKREKNP